MLLLTEAEVEPDIPKVIESFEPNGRPKPLKILLNIYIKGIFKQQLILKLIINKFSDRLTYGIYGPQSKSPIMSLERRAKSDKRCFKMNFDDLVF